MSIRWEIKAYTSHEIHSLLRNEKTASPYFIHISESRDLHSFYNEKKMYREHLPHIQILLNLINPQIHIPLTYIN